MVRFVDYKQIRNRIGMYSGQNIAKIFTCVRYLTGLEKLSGDVLWNAGRRSNENPLCQFIGNFMV